MIADVVAKGSSAQLTAPRPAGRRAAAPPWMAPILLLVVTAAALLRLDSPWIAHQAPAYGRLVEGIPVMRDIGGSGYFSLIHHLAAATQRPQLAWVSNDLYRGWLPIYLAGVIYSWTGQMYWSAAVVDLLAWWLAAVCAYPLAYRLGLSRCGCVAAAVLCATSPAFAETAWMSLFKPANTASLVWSSCATLRILDGEFGGDRGRLGAGVALGLVLLGTSLVYNYVWVVVPCFGAMALVEGPSTRRRGRLITWTVALAIYVALDAALQRALAAAGWPLFVQTNDAAVRVRLLAGQILTAAAPIPEALRLARDFLDPRYMAAVFHPVVLAAGALGIALGPRRLRVVGAVATLLALAQGAMTGLPWVVINNYPFIYVGAGVGLAWVQDAVRLSPAESGRPITPAAKYAPTLITVAAIAALAAATNLDVVGDYAYVRGAWRWLGFPI